MVLASVAALLLLTPAQAQVPPDVPIPILPPLRMPPPGPPPVAPLPMPSAPRASIISSPDWVRKPSGDDVARYYPERAQRMRIEGRAVIGCMVDERGQLVDCAVISETPPDAEFGLAALRMSRLFRMKPKSLNGEPVAGGKVRIPIVFKVPEEEAEQPQIPIDEVMANLAGVIPLGGDYILIAWADDSYRDELPQPYLSLPKRTVGKGRIELGVFGVARTPGPWRDSQLGYSYARVTYDCGKRRTRVNSKILFDPHGRMLAKLPADPDWTPVLNRMWDQDVMTMACGGKKVAWPVHSGLAEVITAVRRGERWLPPIPALPIPPVPAPSRPDGKGR